MSSETSQKFNNEGGSGSLNLKGVINGASNFIVTDSEFDL